MRALCHWMARLLPRDLRAAHGRELHDDIDRRCREGRGWATLADIAAAAVRERRRPRALGHSIARRPSQVLTMNTLLNDVRFAFRMFRRQPGFTLAAILTLGLGIGSSTAIISLADATLLRPVAAHAPERLAELPWASSYPGFREMQKRAEGFDGLLAYGNVSGVSLDRRGVTQRVPATLVSGNYFDVLGIRPAAGRLLGVGDEQSGAAPSIVISDRLWRSSFAASPDVIGESMRLNDRSVVVVGVTPPSFRGLSLSSIGDVWMPAAFAPDLATGFLGRPGALGPDFNWLRVVGRLSEGVSITQASERLGRLYEEMHPPRPGATRDPFVLQAVTSAAIGGKQNASLGQFIMLLFVVAAVLLVLGCANVANLLLARASARRHEVGIRIALGAGRRRLIAQLLVESALLGIAGVAAGLAIASGGLRLLGQYRLPGELLIEDLAPGVNGAVFASALALAGVSVLIFGLVPALLTSRRDVNTVLRESGRTATRTPLGRTLVTLQVCLSVAMIGGGLLFARGLQRGLAFDLGYEPSGVVMMTADPGLERLSPQATNTYVTTALERMRADGSVQSAGISAMRPMRGSMSTSFYPVGYQSSNLDDFYTSVNLVSDGWFETLGIRLVSGRTFTEADRARASSVGLVSESLARKYFPGRNAVGERIRMGEEADAPVVEIIGVVGDARYGAVDAETEPFLYLSALDPAGSPFRGQIHFFARFTGDPSAAAAALRQSAHAANPRVPTFFVMSMEEHVASVLMPQRLGLVLLTAFSVAALVLATAGVYAIAAYSVAARQREIGIRMALGAGRGHVLRQIVRDGTIPVLIGAAAGIAIQLWASDLAESFVFGLDARAPAQLAGAAAVVVAAALVALALPARRAAAVEPTVALRE